MKTRFFLRPSACIMIAAVAFFFSSCDKHLHKEGSGIVLSVERSLPSFTALDVDGRYTVNAFISTQPHVVITTDDNIVSEVRTYVQDGKLFIEMNDDYLTYDCTSMDIDVYGPALSDVEIDGQVDFFVLDTITTTSFDLRHDGRGRSEILFSGSSLVMRMNGSIDMMARGNADNASYTINGEGKTDALQLSANTAAANINGSGKIYLHCEDHLDATIDGSGHIYYTGSPDVDTQIHGSGSVEHY